MKTITPNNLSLVSIYLTMFLEETAQKLATGTGFIYRYDEKLYLITNWHNVTGINPITKRPLSSHGGKPNLITLALRTPNSERVTWNNYPINIYDSEGNAEWFVHPTFEENVDVVAFELDFDPDFTGIFEPINDVAFDDFDIEIADDVLIIGYPLSMTGGGYFPIWKRGSVATEPQIDYEKLPKFLVDTASKMGMSGSPVVFRRNGLHFKDTLEDSVGGLIQGFVGIYSGRIVTKYNTKCNCPKCEDPDCLVDVIDTDSQLGIVWKKKVIEEIIKGKVRDKKNFA